jgi:uncharacterized protein YggL (DUF469 family)
MNHLTGGYYLNQNKQLGVEISGMILAADKHTNINHDEFLDKFIEFVENNNWLFGGGTKQVDEDGEIVK